MNTSIRAFLLLVFLFHAQAQTPESWRGKTSEDRALTISVVQGAVTSLSLNEGISCGAAVDEGAKVFSGPPVPISRKKMGFTGQTTTLCGEIQVRLEGTIEGTKASGNLTILAPKLSASPTKRKVSWQIEKTPGK